MRKQTLKQLQARFEKVRQEMIASGKSLPVIRYDDFGIRDGGLVERAVEALQDELADNCVISEEDFDAALSLLADVCVLAGIDLDELMERIPFFYGHSVEQKEKCEGIWAWEYDL